MYDVVWRQAPKLLSPPTSISSSPRVLVLGEPTVAAELARLLGECAVVGAVADAEAMVHDEVDWESVVHVSSCEERMQSEGALEVVRVVLGLVRSVATAFSHTLILTPGME